LTEDGLKAAANASVGIIVNFPDQHADQYASSHFKRGNYDYLIFAKNLFYGLSVARSNAGVLGPYEAISDFLIPGSYMRNSLVKDIDNEQDALIFGQLGSVFAASIEWSEGFYYRFFSEVGI